jgi:hypothetical protein
MEQPDGPGYPFCRTLTLDSTEEMNSTYILFRSFPSFYLKGDFFLLQY